MPPIIKEHMSGLCSLIIVCASYNRGTCARVDYRSVPHKKSKLVVKAENPKKVRCQAQILLSIWYYKGFSFINVSWEIRQKNIIVVIAKALRKKKSNKD